MTGSLGRLAALLGLALFAAALFFVQGFGRELVRDDAIYLYGGQKLADGVLPYAGIFDHKGPGAQIATGAFVWLGRQIGAADLSAARIGFAGLSAAAALLLFGALRRETGRVGPGLLAGLALLSFDAFTMFATGGPRAKTLVVLFAALALYCVARRAWAGAALAIGLSATVWQPSGMLCLPLAAAMLAGRARWFSWPLVVVAAPLPILAVAGFYHLQGQFDLFWEGYLGFNLTDIARDSSGVVTSIGLLLYHPFESYAHAVPVFFAAVLAAALMPFRRGRLELGLSPGALEVYAAASLLIALAWSLFDVQGAADLFILLPPAAVLAALLMAGLTARRALLERGLALGLMLLAALSPLLARVKPDYRTLTAQRAEVAAIEALCAGAPPGDCVASIGATQLPVLGGFDNWTRFGFVINGVDNHIDRVFPGGLDGWLAALEAKGPRLVVMGDTRGPHADRIRARIAAGWAETEVEGVTSWTVYVRR